MVAAKGRELTQCYSCSYPIHSFAVFQPCKFQQQEKQVQDLDFNFTSLPPSCILRSLPAMQHLMFCLGCLHLLTLLFLSKIFFMFDLWICIQGIIRLDSAWLLEGIGESKFFHMCSALVFWELCSSVRCEAQTRDAQCTKQLGSEPKWQSPRICFEVP